MRLGVGAALVGGTVVPGDVETLDGRIARVGLARGGSGLAVPGLVDLQVNGFGRVDLASADRAGYARAHEALVASGVTAYLPTLITAPESSLAAALAEVPRETTVPRVLGVHLEGPFLSPARPGSHPPGALRDPDQALAGRLLAAGPVRLMTLAPELPGAPALAALLRRRGVVVSAGHSDATAAQAHAAFDSGIRTVTHLFNAMRPFHHRDPGLAGAALVRRDVVVQLILDGRHVAEEAARLAWAAARGRLALVTDALAPAGTKAAAPAGPPTGGLLTLLECVRNLHALGATLPEALGAATAVPARILGRPDVGTLVPGAAADVLVLDDRLDLLRVLVAGADRGEPGRAC